MFLRMYYLSNFCIENISTLQCDTNVKNNLLAGSRRKGVEIVIHSATRIIDFFLRPIQSLVIYKPDILADIFLYCFSPIIFGNCSDL